MQALLRAATLLVVAAVSWGAPSAAGGEALKSPQNVEVSIIDDNITLKWERSDEYDKNVTFSAYYQIPLEINWTELPGCQHVTTFECSFSSDALEDIYKEVQLRVRAEKGSDTSPWYEVDSFVPYNEARIGPPELRLEAEDKAIIITISPPGTEDDNMWATERLMFKYNIVIWNSSGMEQSVEAVHPRYKIYKLSPKTTYCLKVRAMLLSAGKVGFYSPVYCINTTVENKLPPPENVQLEVLNEDYVLKWDYPNDSHEKVTFRAQWLSAYIKMLPGHHAEKWKKIQDCENVRTTYCVIPQAVFLKGIHFIRVQASEGNASSFWSEEKKFDTVMQTVILPPVINMKPTDDRSMHISIGSPEDSENKFVDQDYPLIYEIVFWENSTNAETVYVEKTDFTIDKLKTQTVYCVKARALVEDEKWNLSSVFSDSQCEETKPETSTENMLVAGVFVVLLIVPALTLVVKIFWKYISFVYFPPHKPPSTINEDLSEQPLKNLLLSTSEEQTERCFIIENVNSVTIVEDVRQIDENHKQYSSQTSEDSGNYSNEDENNENKADEPESEN
ncbi:interferon alpha/beta receptor 1 [Sorex fumeus]|uniref:interferon alpha/beta receptor 1 n=1 Tax=Sorex fumeus TaxID=62283 RepID=UPI0024AD07EB|nr:interferon alpha/beta receptor 1 [Sorex fumeus]